MTKKSVPGWRRLLSSVFGGSSAPAAEDSVPPVERRVAPMEGEEDHWVATSLEEMLQREPDQMVHVVTLRQYREALGPEMWPKVGPKVIILAEGVLRQLNRYGASIRYQDDCFLVIYSNLNAAEGTRLTGAVAIELGQRLVGAKFSLVRENIPQVAFASVHASQLLGDDGVVDTGKLNAVADAAPPVAAQELEATPITRTVPPAATTSRAIEPVEHLPDNKWISMPQRPEKDDPEPVLKPISRTAPPPAAPTSRAVEPVEHLPDNKWISMPQRPEKPKPEPVLKPIAAPARKKSDPQWVPMKRD